MELFKINPNLSEEATIMLLSFLDEISVEMAVFKENKALPPASKKAVDNCWTAFRYLVLHTSKKDRGISPNHYDQQRDGLDSLEEEEKALFWSFMFRRTVYMLKKIKSPQYVSNHSYVEVRNQLLEWNKFAQQQYQPFRDIFKSLKKADNQIRSYNEPAGYVVPNLSQN